MSGQGFIQTLTQKELQELVELLKGIQFGSLTLTIREGQLVQIDRSEKIRIKS